MDTLENPLPPSSDVAREPMIADRKAPGDERPWSSDHAVNVRLSIPLPVGRYYLTIVAGRERRSAERRAAERRKHPLRTVGNILFLLTVCSVQTVGALAVVQMFMMSIFGQR